MSGFTNGSNPGANANANANSNVDHVDDCSQLSFGALSSHSEPFQILSTVEVLAVLSQAKEQAGEEDVSDVFQKLHKYAARFGGLDKQAMDGMELDVLSNHLDTLRSTLLNRTHIDQSTGDTLKLHEFEAVQLINLMSPTSAADEAILLIPSLERFGEARVGEFLEIVQRTLRLISA
jgi:hypothetical protein